MPKPTIFPCRMCGRPTPQQRMGTVREFCKEGVCKSLWYAMRKVETLLDDPTFDPTHEVIKEVRAWFSFSTANTFLNQKSQNLSPEGHPVKASRNGSGSTQTLNRSGSVCEEIASSVTETGRRTTSQTTNTRSKTC